METQRFSIPNAPEMTPERKELVEGVIQILTKQELTYNESFDVLNDVYRELQYRSSFVHL